MKISSKNKQKLKGIAHSIKPSIIIGKEGLSKGTIDSINNMLEHKELIKIKFNSYRDESTIKYYSMSQKISTIIELIEFIKIHE